MHDLVLHPATADQLTDIRHSSIHAIIVAGPAGIGKGSLVSWLAADLLGVTPEKLPQTPYYRVIGPESDKKNVSIEAIRTLEQFLALKVPGNGRRVVVVEAAQTMLAEAQNALLKTLEEPPANTTIILATASERALLPTIRSRATVLHVHIPASSAVSKHFQAKGHGVPAIQRAELMSGGLPGLMASLLDDDAHPLSKAAETARIILKATPFERLTMVDALAKQREELAQVLQILQQMAHVALAKSGSAVKIQQTWQRILTASYTASEQLGGSAQPKLLLTEFMLKL